VAQQELLRLSWRIACSDLVHKVAQFEKGESDASDDSKETIDISSLKVVDDNGIVSLKAGPLDLESFHGEFMGAYFKFCPDIKKKFPQEHILVARMIQSAITRLVKGKDDLKKLTSTFANSHRHYDLTKEHFDGFGMALVQTIQKRLGKLGTIQLIQIWKKVTSRLTDELHAAYSKAHGRLATAG